MVVSMRILGVVVLAAAAGGCRTTPSASMAEAKAAGVDVEDEEEENDDDSDAGADPDAIAQCEHAAFGPFDGCPMQGEGGDPILNCLKNRHKMPASFKKIDVPAVMSLHIPESGHRKRNLFSAGDSQKMSAIEEKGVVLTGYLLDLKKSGKEACNCGSTEFTDFHMYVGEEQPATAAKAKEMIKSSVIVEPPPYWQSKHASWTPKALKALATAHRHVRIYGWPMFDAEHPELMTMQKRGTLWEIHPVVKIEYEDDDGTWQEL